MENRKRGLISILIGLCAMLAAAVAFLYVPYRRDIQAAYNRLQALESQSAETPCGKVEYAVQGEGYPVLLVHGNGGGFDQGLDLGAVHIGDEFMGVAPSRFGYLATPLPAGATPQMQADAFACLLDELGIQQAAVIAWSAGGMSAVQLALRHPDRVSALVLVSSGISETDGSDEVGLPPEPVLRTVLGSDFLFWLLVNPLQSLTQRMFVSTAYELTPKDKALLDDALQNTLPVRPRTQGAVFDTLETITDPHRNRSAYRLEDMTVPTLVINARDDPAANYEAARAMSQRIPQARLVTINEGGHLMLGSGELVRQEINLFLREQSEPQ
jgi:2-hydroxy-6-oxonona-2,4-dienedioate hydrolase